MHKWNLHALCLLGVLITCTLVASTLAIDTASLGSGFYVMVLDEAGELVLDATVAVETRDGPIKATSVSPFLSEVGGFEGVWPDAVVLNIERPSSGLLRVGIETPANGGVALVSLAEKHPDPMEVVGPCPLDCPPGALVEGEPCGDDTNGGCNAPGAPAFENAACGDTWCGTSYADGGTRDTDWYLVAHAGGTLSATVASQFPAVLFIVDIDFPNCSPATVGDIGCGDDCASIATASAQLPAGTYAIFVAPGTCDGGGIYDGLPCGGGNNDYVLTIDCEPPCVDNDDCPPGLICVDGICVPPPPLNDLCENAAPLEVDPGGSVDVLGRTNDATFDDVGECGVTNTAPGVWYSVVGNGNTMTASTCNQADYDTKISVFCRECLPGDLLCVTGLDDFPGCGGFTTEVSWCAQAGAEYLILVHGFSSATGTFTLTVSDDGMACVPDVECIPTGGCCQCGDGYQFCTIETEEDCAALGGLYLGDNAACATAGEPLVYESFPNVDIPDDDVVGVSDTIDVVGAGTILDLDVDLQIDHTFIGDLCVTLTSPGGIPVTLIQRMGADLPCDAASCCGCGANNLDIVLDDAAADPIEEQCADDLTGSYVPDDSLGIYGGSADGTWMITVNDNAGLDTGVLLGWSLHFAQPAGGPSPCEEAFPTQCEIELPLDIKPGSCPNSFNRGSNGVLPVGLLGTDDFDITQVDVSSVVISRADGGGGSVGPIEGPRGPRSRFKDVGTPFDGELCECHELERDGITDLSMKFNTPEVVEALELDDFPGGALVELCVSGVLLDGTPFTGCDCIRLVPPGVGGRRSRSSSIGVELHSSTARVRPGSRRGRSGLPAREHDAY